MYVKIYVIFLISTNIYVRIVLFFLQYILMLLQHYIFPFHHFVIVEEQIGCVYLNKFYYTIDPNKYEICFI